MKEEKLRKSQADSLRTRAIFREEQVLSDSEADTSQEYEDAPLAESSEESEVEQPKDKGKKTLQPRRPIFYKSDRQRQEEFIRLYRKELLER